VNGLSAEELTALIDRYGDAREARRLLERADFPNDFIPNDPVPALFWHEINRYLSHGALPDGRRKVLAAAALDYPGARLLGAGVESDLDPPTQRSETEARPLPRPDRRRPAPSPKSDGDEPRRITRAVALAASAATAAAAVAAATGLFGLLGGQEPPALPTPSATTALSATRSPTETTIPATPALSPGPSQASPDLADGLAGERFEGTVHQEGLDDYTVTVEFLGQLRTSHEAGALVGHSSYEGTGKTGQPFACQNDLYFRNVRSDGSLSLLERATSGSGCYTEDELRAIGVDGGVLHLELWMTVQQAGANLPSDRAFATAALSPAP
jgi:hypothetical protein